MAKKARQEARERAAQKKLKLQATIEAYRLGKYPNVSATAKALGVTRSTLQYRVNGRKSRHKAHEHQQELTKNEEAALTSWILELAANGFPARYKTVHQMAEEIRRHRIAEMNSEDVERINIFPLSKEWVKHFLQ
jgi:ribosomal protein L20A (L18A)